MLRDDAVVGDIGRNRVHHHLHHSKPGNEQPEQRASRLLFARGRGGERIDRCGAIPQFCDGFEYGAESLARRIPSQPRPIARQLHVDIVDAVHGANPAPDCRHAGRAMHALDNQRHFRAVRIRAHYPSLLARGIVERRPGVGCFRPCPASRILRAGRLRPELRQRQAPVATIAQGLLRVRRTDVHPWRQRQATVIAARVCPRRRPDFDGTGR